MKNKTTLVLTSTLCLTLMACERGDRNHLVYDDQQSVSVMFASAETTPVASADDAADDPAIWVHPTEPARSLIVGTDKKAGLGVYNLQGELVQFTDHGEPNNVDIRQNIIIQGQPTDLVAFSDRATNTVGWASIDDSGISLLDSFATDDEPYGFCLGMTATNLYAFVTYKTGVIEKYELLNDTDMQMPKIASYQLETQLEGCVFDDLTGDLYVGEEAKGVWKFATTHNTFVKPLLIDEVGSTTGIVADIEGMSIYRGETPLLVVSSQENDSFALYELAPPHRFVKRFRIMSNASIDGAQETDGLDVTATPLPNYPNGLLVVQDGFNDDGHQNFKLVNANFE
jgi:3-phytase